MALLRIDDKQEFIVKELTTRAEIDYIQYHNFPESDDILRFIRLCKANNIDYSAAGSNAKEYVPDPQMLDVYVDIYKKYEQFADDDDPYTRVQLLTYALFRDVPEVKAKWQEKFSLIFVDEYQDTDPVQYEIIKALAEKHQNLRVVGDDDQGIYEWRGADIQNILNFEKDYPNAKVISLGQNYRSTQRIVGTSRALVDFNLDRREKELFTKNFEGEKVKHLHCKSDEEEASTIATFVHRSIDQDGRLPSDFAVLYRNNKQAPAFKKAFKDLGIRVRGSSDTDTTRVSMMTIHKSKGLEFPNVFVVGICQGLLPNYYNQDEKDWDEEIRLLYVAMTRAENWLCLSSYDGYQRGQSPFLKRGYIPSSLLESIDTLENTPIPPAPETMIAPKEPYDYIEPLPEELLGSGMTVIGVDPGNIGARKTNVGWSVTRKVVDGYSVLDHDTQCLTGEKEYKLEQIKHEINSLVESFSPDAIAVEKFEVATEKAREDWFYHVAGCVATIRSIAHQHGIECHLYTPQQVKYIATDNRSASKLDVQKGVMRICNLKQIPESDHSADAIATSLCYLRNYLNSSRFEGNKRKQERYKVGCNYLEKRQYEAAVNEFKETINIDPIYTEVHCGLASAYLGQDKLEEAENSAKEALRLDSSFQPALNLLEDIKQAYYNRGRNHLNNQQYDEAITAFEETTNRYPKFTAAHCGIGQAYLGKGNLTAAEKSAKEALKLENDYQSALQILESVKQNHYEIGRNYFNQGDLRAAEKSAKEAIRLDPNYQPTRELLENIKHGHVGKGNNYLRQGELDPTQKAAKEALRLDSSFQPALNLLEDIKQAYYNRGRNHLNNQQYDEAITAFKETIDRYPKFTAAHCGIGQAYLGKGNLTAAEKSAKEALKLENDYQSALQILENIKQKYCEFSRDYLNQDNLAAAEKSANYALRLALNCHLNCQLARALLENIKQEYHNRGCEHLDNQRYKDAIDAFTKTINKYPDFTEAYYRLSQAYLGQGNLEKAEKSAKEALKLENDYQPALQILKSVKQKYYKDGMSHLDRGNLTSAERSVNEALRLEPDHPQARALLEDIKQEYHNRGCKHLDNQRYEDAIDAFTKTINKYPDFTKAHYRLAQAYFEQGDDLVAAEESIKETLKLDLNYQPAHTLLGDIKQEYHNRGIVHIETGEYNKAIKPSS